MVPSVSNCILVLTLGILISRRVHCDDSKIVNGIDAEYGRFPYFVMLFAEINSDEAELCGGSLLSEIWVLTAAHCLQNAFTVLIRLGAIYSEPENPDGSDDGSLVFNSTDFIIHEDYDPDTLQNDIAVVRIPEAVQFSDRIGPVRLPSGQDSYLGRDAIACGFGYERTNGEPSDRLKYIELNVFDNTACSVVYPGSVFRSTLCAIGRQRKSICQGDSGGPLTLENSSILIGVTSFGSRIAGCERGFPQGFARVTEFTQWILEHTGVGTSA
ncbi:collagenase-like [Uranotaenia lowii]|uniref:collagenase-like n=1 Tax=Uranotaenia lowii TaxID=190385 RepID=UPI00247A6B7E|nr:collagenase-like [Uranotaenia lowii]